MPEIPKAYLPGEVERAWYQRWLDAKCFAADPHSAKPKYSIVIPPPNVTGILTLGHVLNNTIQDILARRARMQGKEVLWLPGTDHAGIATQNVVEKTLKKEGVMRHRDDLGREKLLEKIWEWKEKHGGIIIEQLKKLGASCDWDRERFTMDEDYSRCVQRVFVDLYKKGLIYRGRRMVNWCPVSQTALSDEEVEMKPQKGLLYYFQVEVIDEPARPRAVDISPEQEHEMLGERSFEQSRSTDEDRGGQVESRSDGSGVGQEEALLGFTVGRGEDQTPVGHSSSEFRIVHERSDTEPGRTFLTIATTRPETIPGDTGIAVSPKDPRYAQLIGKRARRPLPLENQAAIPIVGDDQIDPEFGTGVLKVTPAHDKVDFEIGQRHGLEPIDIIHPNGVMNELAGKDLAGLDRFEARKKAADLLREMGAMVKEEPYQNNVGFSERAGVPIEPRLSDQWFLKYPSQEQSRAVVATGQMNFFPERWARVYDHWMGNLQDWCISRQLWWGHRVPVWRKQVSPAEFARLLPEAASFMERMGAFGSALTEGSNVQAWFHDTGFEDSFSRTPGELSVGKLEATEGHINLEVATYSEVEAQFLTSAGFTQDPDVLDTWFSSWLWPFATMGWPEQTDTLRAFYPTTDLVTGPDIIFFWVARMIMAGYEYMGEKPFRNVYFTGIIRDKQGRKMSKSLGNSPDPLDLIAKYGADALRFGIMRSAPQGLDLLFDEGSIEQGRNFANKLWNACRYRQMQGPTGSGETPDPNKLRIYAVDILAKLDQLAKDLDEDCAAYEFNRAAQHLYEFFWANYCDLYLETIKGDASAETLATQDAVLRRFLLLLHPFMPHITEELWRTLGFGAEGEFLMLTLVPKEPVLRGFGTGTAATRAAMVYETAAQLRNLKAEYGLASNREVKFILAPSQDWVANEVGVLRLLVGAAEFRAESNFAAPSGTPAVVTKLGEVMMPLAGLIDVEKERERLAKELAKIDADLEKTEASLARFNDNTPETVVSKTEARLEELKEKRAKIANMTKALG